MAQTHAEGTAEQHVAPDMMIHICEHSIRVLHHQICSVLYKKNTIGYKWLKYVNQKQHLYVKHDFVVINRKITHSILTFSYNPVEDYTLSQHVFISIMTEVHPF
ncbi:hypothetical protein TNCV_745531 [Trichonephila clavipes]|nr:hypothetical protein TNCV_745531 [Trichonephila clavipes]